jgi:hypothetical protein
MPVDFLRGVFVRVDCGRFALNIRAGGGIQRGVRRWFAILSLLLAVLWAPATSHCLLEHAGWIHHAESCAQHDATGSQDHDHDYGHDAADGACHVASNDVDFAKRATASGQLVAWLAVTLLNVTAQAHAPAAGFADDGFARDFSPRWQFVLRTALSPRAPSC